MSQPQLHPTKNARFENEYDLKNQIRQFFSGGLLLPTINLSIVSLCCNQSELSIFEHKYIKKDCRLTGEYLKSYNSFVGKIVFLQNNNWLTFDRNHTLSCFFSPHGKNEDKPIHINFWYPQGQSVFPIHNTIGQNRS